MSDVMVDLETMSTRSNAAIASIGAVIFDPTKVQTREELISVENTFYMKVDLETQADRHFDPGTIYWWLTQSDGARNEICMGQKIGLNDMLQAFQKFCGKHMVRNGWSNGANFDHVIMESAYRMRNIENPLRFTQQLCHRTITKVCPSYLRPTISGGTAHKALDDALFQTMHLQKCFEYMRGKGATV